MQTDVKAIHLDASGLVYAGPTRLKGYSVSPGGTAGEIILYDNASGATGTVRFTINVSTNQALDSLIIPGEGIKFDNGMWLAMPVNSHITFYYG